MVRTLTRRYSTQNAGSFRLLDNPMRHHQQQQQQNTTAAGGSNEHVDDVDDNLQPNEDKSTGQQNIGESVVETSQERPQIGARIFFPTKHAQTFILFFSFSPSYFHFFQFFSLCQETTNLVSVLLLYNL